MCTHEESTQPKPTNAWRLIDGPCKPMEHLYNADNILTCLRLSIEALQEQSNLPELYNLYSVCVICEKELAAACGGLEDVLSSVSIPAT